MCALSQWEQLVVKTNGTRYQNHIVCNSPRNTLTAVRCSALRSIALLVDVWWADRYAGFHANAPVQARQTHPVAERVRKYASIDTARTEVQECCEEAEQRSVRELEQRS